MRPAMPQAEALAGRASRGLVADAAERLRGAGSPSPRLDAELLVAHAFGRDRAWLLAHPEERLASADLVRLGAWVERRAGGEPIAYIRGFKEWLSLKIATDRRALIPRPETELLAESAMGELAARLARDQEIVRAWEVGTGSGAVATAIGLRFRTAMVLHRVVLIASDISAEALELASENLASHGLSGLVTLACGDLLEPAAIGLGDQLDLLVANLPYLTSAEASANEGSLRHEPRLALDGGIDGMDLIRRLLVELPTRLAPGGVALLEIGATQEQALRTAVSSLPGAWSVSVRADLAGLPRVARVSRALGT
jgi:release factor glutamine methyltransferase